MLTFVIVSRHKTAWRGCHRAEPLVEVVAIIYRSSGSKFQVPRAGAGASAGVLLEYGQAAASKSVEKTGVSWKESRETVPSVMESVVQ